MPYLRLARPEQWVKNVFVFAGLVFAQRLTVVEDVLAVSAAFVLFSLLSSAVYVFNDIRDREEDRLHPKKRFRPLAAGQISLPAAGAFALLLAGGGLGGAFVLDRGFFLVAAAYVTLQALYSLWLKHAVVLDVILIGSASCCGRSPARSSSTSRSRTGLVLCTFTLCLFMGFSKRRCELHALARDNGAHAAKHRRTLADYTPDLLNHMTTLTAGIAVVSFMLYATDDRTMEKFGTSYLIYTVPIVVYAVFRYTLLVEHGRVEGPTAVVLRDRPFQAALVLWGLAVLVIVYRGVTIREWLLRFTQAGG
jgi:4-hydroxybenzoate polyprenyltransferase